VTLLTPISALIGALVVMPLIVALYLLKLRRRPVRVGSMLFWPGAAEDLQANVPLRWLRPSLLLLLHVLMVACLLLALGRPAIHGSRITSDRVVLLIDASASMSARDDGASPQTRLTRAQRRAKELCEQLAGGWFRPASSIAVVSFAHRARVVSAFTSSPTMLGASIDAIAPTDQPGDITAAMQLVDTLLHADEDGEAASDAPRKPATIILLSDGSFHATHASPSGSPRVSGTVRFERIGPAIGASPPLAANAGVLAVSSLRDSADPALVRVFVRVGHNQPRTLELPVWLALDGEVQMRRVVALPPGGGEGGGQGITLGDAETVFELRLATPAVCTIGIEHEPDALSSDDRASVWIDGSAALRVALVRGQLGPGSAAQGTSWLLGDVLREISGAEVPVITLDEAQKPQAPYDLLVFDRCSPARVPAIPSISFGAAPPLARVRVVASPFAPRPASLYWSREHPMLRGLTLDGLVVSRAVTMTTEDAPTPITSDIAAHGGVGTMLLTAPTIIARSENLPLITLAREAGVEHCVVAFALEDSNWPLQAGFAVFLANATEHLTAASAGRAGRFFLTTQPVVVRVASRTPASLVGPSTIALREDAALTDDVAELSAGVLDRAGVYVVRGGGLPPRADRAVCVNLTDATESAIAAPENVRVDGLPLEGVTSRPGPREVWHWLVLALLGLLTIEWIVFARQARA
jgi:hypothetical protein